MPLRKRQKKQEEIASQLKKQTEKDATLSNAKNLLDEFGTLSAPFLQYKLKISYDEAFHIMERLNVSFLYAEERLFRKELKKHMRQHSSKSNKE